MQYDSKTIFLSLLQSNNAFVKEYAKVQINILVEYKSEVASLSYISTQQKVIFKALKQG